MRKNQSIIQKVALEMGGKIEKIIPERGCFYINLDGEKIFVSRKFKIVSNPLGGKELTEFKDLTSFLLKEKGLPTPNTVCFYYKNLNEKDLVKKLKTLRYPIVIKDATGSNSRGVFTNIENTQQAQKLILEKIEHFRSLVAQEMVFGREYRVLILKNKAIGVLEMIPPRIFGDGKNTVRKLIEKKQEKTPRKTVFDKALNETLGEQGVNLKTILENNQEIFIKRNSSLAEGGETKNATKIINPEIKNICVQAAKTVGNYLAGIDLICEDISKNLNEQKMHILEINGRPDLYIHYNPTHGETRNVIKDILEFILKFKKLEK